MTTRDIPLEGVGFGVAAPSQLLEITNVLR